MRPPNLLGLLGLPLALISSAAAQQPGDDPELRSLAHLKAFAVHAQVQVSRHAALETIDESLLRDKLESAMRREGISVQASGDVRDGSQAQISLVYLVIGTGYEGGEATGFAASSCIQVLQLVMIPRFSRDGRKTYTMAETWRSCGMITGARRAFRASVLRNADDQIDRFLAAWRSVNRSSPAPVPSNSELGSSMGRGREGGKASDLPRCLTVTQSRITLALFGIGKQIRNRCVPARSHSFPSNMFRGGSHGCETLYGGRLTCGAAG